MPVIEEGLLLRKLPYKLSHLNRDEPFRSELTGMCS